MLEASKSLVCVPSFVSRDCVVLYIKDEEEEEEGKKDSEDFLSLIFCTRVHTLNRFGLFFDSVGLYVGTSRDHDERLNTLVVLFLYNTHV